MLQTFASHLYITISVIAVLTLSGSVAYWLLGHQVLPLGNFICFGTQNRKSKPFAELQAEQLVALVFDESELVHSQDTAFQSILVYRHPHFGHILTIDGSLQITQRDEHIYHEMMVHVPMAYLLSSSQQRRQRVILVGGGDGGANTQLFKYSSVESVHHIDIDMKAMRDVTQSFFPHLYSSFLDTRLHTFSYDGNQWIRERLDDASQVASFDLIIVDSTDYGSAETLFTNEFYENLKLLLRTDRSSMMLLNLDSPQWNAMIVATVQQQLAKIFKYAFVYQCAQPSFLSGSYSYLLVSDTVHPLQAKIDWSAFESHNVNTHYYTPDMHYAAFALPADLARQVSMAGQFKDVPAFSRTPVPHEPWPEVAVAAERLQPSPATHVVNDDEDEEGGGGGGGGDL